MKTKSWFTVDDFAKLEGVSTAAIHKRIKRGAIKAEFLKRESRQAGGYRYSIHAGALSAEAKMRMEVFSVTAGAERETIKKRKERKDKGSSSVPAHIIVKTAAVITMKRVSSPNKLKRNGYGYKEGWDYFKDICLEEKIKPVGYRRFLDLVKPFVDKEVQRLNNKGVVKFRNENELVLLHDHSVWEPMQFIQNDHTQFDCVCIHEGKIIRPWAAFHGSVGDRIVYYPTIVERPDSFSLADNIANFVLQYGLSRKPVLYKSDHGKAQKSKLMTDNKTSVELRPYKLEERHEKIMRLMGIGLSHEKGIIENMGMVESHSTVKLPRTKWLERTFGIGGTMEWFKDRPEYTGRNYREKPEGLEKRIKNREIWTSEEMVDYVIGEIDKYNNRFHSAIKKERGGRFAIPADYDVDLEYFRTDARALRAFGGYYPKSMNDVIKIFNSEEFAKSIKTELYSPMWARKVYEICGWESRPLPARETLSMLAMKAVERTVHNYGILINNNAYINMKLRRYIGEKVVVRYSPDNITKIREQSGKEVIFIKEIAVFERVSEKFICIAEPHPRVVTETHAYGYAKTFIRARADEMKELIETRKITTEYAKGKIEADKRPTNIVGIQPNREIAALRLKEATILKKHKSENKKKEKVELITELEDLYGTKIKIEGGES